MRIKWLAHASFLIQGGGGVRIITDPYTPEEMNFGYIKEPADIVIRSSSDDEGHCFAEMIQGHPEVATATEFADQQIIVKGIPISAISTQESLIYKQDPRDNAMYRFELDDIRVGHFGDVGNRLTEDHLSKMSGIDVALVPTGGPPTIDLEDLYMALQTLKPRITIPMHYALPGTPVKMFPVTRFTSMFSAEAVKWVESSEIEISKASLPQPMQVIVLRASTAEPDYSDIQREEWKRKRTLQRAI